MMTARGHAIGGQVAGSTLGRTAMAPLAWFLLGSWLLVSPLLGFIIGRAVSMADTHSTSHFPCGDVTQGSPHRDSLARSA
jgi:hypothetical protein